MLSPRLMRTICLPAGNDELLSISLHGGSTVCALCFSSLRHHSARYPQAYAPLRCVVFLPFCRIGDRAELADVFYCQVDAAGRAQYPYGLTQTAALKVCASE